MPSIMANSADGGDSAEASSRSSKSRKGAAALKNRLRNRMGNLTRRSSAASVAGAVPTEGGSSSSKTKEVTHTQLSEAWQRRQYADQLEQMHNVEIAALEQARSASETQQKREKKELDGFCRRVDSYDGQLIVVDGKAAYELGNYLGGGVAGVVYEGIRLLPIHEYPVRWGIADTRPTGTHIIMNKHQNQTIRGAADSPDTKIDQGSSSQLSLFENDPTIAESATSFFNCTGASDQVIGEDEPAAFLRSGRPTRSGISISKGAKNRHQSGGLERLQEETNQNTRKNSYGKEKMAREVAIEVPAEPDGTIGDIVVMESIDAPSRSRHAARASSMHPQDSSVVYSGGEDQFGKADLIGDGDNAMFGLLEETVAIKILNPVGFRLLTPTATQTAVIIKEGEPMSPDVISGMKPMGEKHVWWLVNPNSRNLRALQRKSSRALLEEFDAHSDQLSTSSRANARTCSPKNAVDRGKPDRGLRLSLVAAFIDPKTNMLRELPLTRCIEVWGHAPFGASETEFEDMMDAIERVNAGNPHPVQEANFPPPPGSPTPSRVGTGGTESSLSITSAELSNGKFSSSEIPLISTRTGLNRAAGAKRTTVYCPSLDAYIAVPAVPPKFLRWLRQRRAATKEIRNMMLIGRHKNVVHLYEVLELVQDSKSTLFLVLELVRGGELFDLISSSSSTSPKNKSDTVPDTQLDDSESMMRKFFRELASGIEYCHMNGIAHRDLKPENLLVHNDEEGDCTLKIADFGLSATFALNHGELSLEPDEKGDILEKDDSSRADTMSIMKNGSKIAFQRDTPLTGLSPLMNPINSISALGNAALTYLSCGNVEDITACFPSEPGKIGVDPMPIRRMTSVVGSPHYVAPEIISQNDEEGPTSENRGTGSTSNSTGAGYDGTKADVWSAGVILYAMLFRSLPFGEDLLRCPRYQSFSKWYENARTLGGRRSSGVAALSPFYDNRDVEEMLGPSWFFPSETSVESRDLIVAMLNPDPFERLSINMVLQHPWIITERPKS